MKVLMQFAVLFIICLVGDALADLLPVPFPGSVMAMLVLFALLYAGALKLRHVEQVADFLIANMAFLFLPLAVGIHDSYTLLSGQLGRVLLVCVASTVIAFGVAALAAGAVLKLQDGRKGAGRDA